MVNLAELLKNASYGTELWCTLYGKVYLISIDPNKRYPIQIRLNDSTKVRLDRYGKCYDNFEEGECVLFPSKDCRTWEGWKAPTNSKFKIGDWIIFDKHYTIPIQITSIKQEEGIYICKTTDDIYGNYDIVDIDKKYHLWTVQDANDGDVLISRIGNPFIYNGNIEFSSVGAYVGVSQNGKIVLDMFPSRTWTSTISVKPATKEECELLFQKIEEIGYKWDSCKKELYKIKHYDISSFHAGMPVLVRDANNKEWRYVLYSHYTKRIDLMHFNAGSTIWSQCIPFNEKTKHLLGTTEMCPEEYINW